MDVPDSKNIEPAPPKDSIPEILTAIKKKKDKVALSKAKVDGPYTRYVSFPGDDHFNGKELVCQFDIPKKVIEEYPDTVRAIAIEMYKMSEQSFPVSIADDFERGISTEHIMYLPFRYAIELFENEFASKPYATRRYTVKRENDGQYSVQ